MSALIVSRVLPAGVFYRSVLITLCAVKVYRYKLTNLHSPLQTTCIVLMTGLAILIAGYKFIETLMNTK